MRENFKQLNLVLLVLILANVLVWQPVVFGADDSLKLFFLDVGQGDSQLVDFAGIQILIDGGKGPAVLSGIGKVLLPGDHYLDIVIATHPDLDHFGGLIDVFKTYEVGLVITNGRKGTAAAYADFEKVIAERKIPTAVMSAGDSVEYGDLTLTALYPDIAGAEHKKVNESGLVLMLEKDGLRALYTADIGFETEQKLLSRYDLSAQILKVGHHGSKYSTGKGFLNEVQPKVAVIGVGRNSYGHPTDSALDRLADIGSKIFRTDREGTIRATFDKRVLSVYNQR